MIKEKICVLKKEDKIFGLYRKYQAPSKANKTCDAARATITGEKPPIKKPAVVPMTTARAAIGEMNMAIKMGT
ncbi:hypothetical protein FACS1894216_12510 [Synergistales bacterium]|nr:hypothetical protein FACS1894216_12510 [Synergistales bacterium]